MISKEEFERYQRQLALPAWDESCQEKLKKAKVLIIGAGGLGCPVLAYLAAAGVGHIGIADFDRVEVSNLQRQILYTPQDAGKLKAEVAATKLKVFNPLIEIQAFSEGLTKENAFKLIEAYDLIVDGSDNFDTRYLINDVCIELNKPFVFGAIQGFEGHVSVFNYQNGPTYRCLFPQPPAPSTIPDCNENGVIGTLPGITACIQATEVIKMLSGLGEVLSGQLMRFDVMNNRFQTFQFNENPESRKISREHTEAIRQKNKTSVRMISREEYQQKFGRLAHQTIDVSQNAIEPLNESSLHIPLYEIEYFEQATPELPLVLYCRNGISSKQAALLLMNKGYQEVYCLI